MHLHENESEQPVYGTLYKPAFPIVSSIHKDITERLYHLNLPLYEQAHRVLMHNKEERHIRGGMATRRKYRGE